MLLTELKRSLSANQPGEQVLTRLGAPTERDQMSVDSFNYWFTIMGLRRALVGLLLVPGAARPISRLTGERLDVIEGHRQLLREHGLHYMRDRQLFLDHNTDGPGNPLSKVYGREDARRLFASFDEVHSAVRFLHLRNYPGGDRLVRTALARQLERKWGWHLWIDARKTAVSGAVGGP